MAKSLSSVSRRDFVRVCTMAAAAVGLGPLAAERFVEAAASGQAVGHLAAVSGVHRLHRVAAAHGASRDRRLIFDLISLDYHETLFAAAGHQAEAARFKTAMTSERGQGMAYFENLIRPRKTGSTA